MRKRILLLVISLSLISCERNGDTSGACTYNGHTLHVGEKGGCYYVSSGGNKEYVDKSYCSGCN
jgi:hypothetical protein